MPRPRTHRVAASSLIPPAASVSQTNQNHNDGAPPRACPSQPSSRHSTVVEPEMLRPLSRLTKNLMPSPLPRDSPSWSSRSVSPTSAPYYITSDAGDAPEDTTLFTGEVVSWNYLPWLQTPFNFFGTSGPPISIMSEGTSSGAGTRNPPSDVEP